MRIAIVTETFLPKIDGITNTLCRLLEYLPSHGHSSIMFAPDGAPAIYADTPVFRPASAPFIFYPELKVANPWINMEPEMAAFKPDLIHVINPFSLGISGTIYARWKEIPLVASYHTDIPGYTHSYGVPFLAEFVWNYFRLIHNQADLTLCPSTATMQELEQHGFNNLKIWSRGVDLEKYSPAKRNAEWRKRFCGDNPHAKLLLYVGRLAVEKRVDWLEPVMRSLPDTHLVIVGDGPEKENLQNLFAGANTTFTGYLLGEELACAYASADLFVFPSANETFGNVVLEAMASGLPVIAPNSGGVTDSVIHGITGLLFEAANRDDLVSAVERMIGSPALAREMGETGRSVALERGWDAVMDKLIEDYQSVIHTCNLRKAGQGRPLQPAKQESVYQYENHY
jgi:phosphatidylinositol alpha 1,6-mannosyltransferase